MPTQIIVRPISGTLRCAACHDDLLDRRFTCHGCRVVLHRDCRAGLKRCPTYGCAALTLADRVVTPAAPIESNGRGLLFHLVWLVPGVLSFLWPVLFGVMGAENPMAFLLALLLGPAVGHGCLAAYAQANGDSGSPHARAAVAEVVGFAASIPLMVIMLLAFVARLW